MEDTKTPSYKQSLIDEEGKYASIIEKCNTNIQAIRKQMDLFDEFPDLYDMNYGDDKILVSNSINIGKENAIEFEIGTAHDKMALMFYINRNDNKIYASKVISINYLMDRARKNRGPYASKERYYANDNTYMHYINEFVTDMRLLNINKKTFVRIAMLLATHPRLTAGEQYNKYFYASMIYAYFNTVPKDIKLSGRDILEIKLVYDKDINERIASLLYNGNYPDLEYETRHNRKILTSHAVNAMGLSPNIFFDINVIKHTDTITVDTFIVVNGLKVYSKYVLVLNLEDNKFILTGIKLLHDYVKDFKSQAIFSDAIVDKLMSTLNDMITKEESEKHE